MIHLNNLTKIFKTRENQITAIDSLNCRINKGEIFGLLGPNGAGKTTTVKILSTLIAPTSGSATVNGYDIIHEGRATRASIGLSVGDERSFYFRLSGYQNLEFFGALYGLSGKVLKSKIEEVMNLLGLGEAKEIKFMKYSSGMKKKLNLARALLCAPPIYFFDEPTSSIDPQSAVNIRSRIKALRDEGKTILLTSHNMYEVEELCDRIAIMDKGRMKIVASPADLKKRMKCSLIKIRMDAQNMLPFRSKISKLACVDNILSQENGWVAIKTSEKITFISSMYRIIAESRITISDLDIQDPNLEDVFINFTEGR